MAFPLEVSVREPPPRKIKEPVCDHVVVADMTALPFMLTDTFPANVPVNPVKSKLAQLTPEVTVTVTAPEVAVKNTSSAAVGTAWPPAPPSVKAHLVPAVASHEAVPPTQ